MTKKTKNEEEAGIGLSELTAKAEKELRAQKESVEFDAAIEDQTDDRPNFQENKNEEDSLDELVSFHQAVEALKAAGEKTHAQGFEIDEKHEAVILALMTMEMAREKLLTPEGGDWSGKEEKGGELIEEMEAAAGDVAELKKETVQAEEAIIITGDVEEDVKKGNENIADLTEEAEEIEMETEPAKEGEKMPEEFEKKLADDATQSAEEQKAETPNAAESAGEKNDGDGGDGPDDLLFKAAVAGIGAAAVGALIMAGKEKDREAEGGVAKKSGETEKIYNLEKISHAELQKRVYALYNAMDKILSDAAETPYKKSELSKIKKWMKKGGEVSDWPLNDAVTAENYAERLKKYNVAQYVEPKLIGKNKDAYAVVAEQYARYQKMLAESGGKEKSGEVEIEMIASAESEVEKIGEEKEQSLEALRREMEEPMKEDEGLRIDLEKEMEIKIGSKVKVKNKDGKIEDGWRLDGYDDQGRAKVSKKKFLRKAEMMLIGKEEFEKLNI
jgi:hypothetical protein